MWRGRAKKDKQPGQGVSSSSADLVRAYVVDGVGTEGSALDRDRTDQEFLSTLLTMAVLKRFDAEMDPRQVGVFVSEFNSRAPSCERIRPRVSEALIRAALGEVHLLSFVSSEEIFEAMPLLIRCLVRDLSLTDGEVDKLLYAAGRWATVVKAFSLMDDD